MIVACAGFCDINMDANGIEYIGCGFYANRKTS